MDTTCKFTIAFITYLVASDMVSEPTLESLKSYYMMMIMDDSQGVNGVL